MLIIGDVHGRFKTLRALLKKCPPELPISVGDMCDRGPSSKEVFRFFMTEGQAVLGNHEKMLLDALNDQPSPFGPNSYEVWMRVGGAATIASFGWTTEDGEKAVDFDGDIFDWLTELPLTLAVANSDPNGPALLVSHAPIAEKPLKAAMADPEAFVWGRASPIEPPTGEQRLFGHMSHWGLCDFTFDKNGRAYRERLGERFPKRWSVACIDSSESRLLTAVQWPSGRIFQQEFLD